MVLLVIKNDLGYGETCLICFIQFNDCKNIVSLVYEMCQKIFLESIYSCVDYGPISINKNKTMIFS